MEFINAIILGLVEGLTEFLPVSSTGHLIIAESFFGFKDKAFADTFMVVIQSGAIFAVVLTFWQRFLPIGKDKVAIQAAGALWLRTLAAFLPFMVLALVLKDSIKSLLFYPLPVAIALLVWGVLIIAIERLRPPSKTIPGLDRPETFPWKIVVFIGLFQCLALWPGTSRSAATIVGALFLGVGRLAAAEFSFFLAIPTLLGAAAYEMLNVLQGDTVLSSTQWILIGIGSLTSFIVALGVIHVFLSFIRTKAFTGFGVYRIILALAVLAWSFFGGPAT